MHAQYPTHREPQDYDDDYLLDVASVAMIDPTPLAEDCRLVRAICGLAVRLHLRDSGSRVTELEAARIDTALRSATLAITTRSYDDALEEIRVETMEDVL